MEERFHTFTTLIANITRCIHKIKSEEMAEYDLKSSHLSCLYYLYKTKSMTAKELCDMCGEDKANISRAIKYLEGKGYLTCRSKTEKRYQAPIDLTDLGKRVGERIAKRIDAILDRIGAGMNEEQRAVMYRALRVISGNLQEMCDGYGI